MILNLWLSLKSIFFIPKIILNNIIEKCPLDGKILLSRKDIIWLLILSNKSLFNDVSHIKIK